MDMTPAVPAGRQVIESYGGGRFRVSGASVERFVSRLFVFVAETHACVVDDRH